jgi:hypothetical protein
MRGLGEDWEKNKSKSEQRKAEKKKIQSKGRIVSATAKVGPVRSLLLFPREKMWVGRRVRTLAL